MYEITTLFSRISRPLVGSIAALAISTVMISTAAADIPTTYNNSCAACHDSGALGAIKRRQRGVATDYKTKGMPALVKSVKGGMIQMPAGGLCDNCSDDDYRKLIDYMSK